MKLRIEETTRRDLDNLWFFPHIAGVKNPAQEHGASSMEKAICFIGANRQRTSLVSPQHHIAIHPRPGERGILAFSRKSTQSVI